MRVFIGLLLAVVAASAQTGQVKTGNILVQGLAWPAVTVTPTGTTGATTYAYTVIGSDASGRTRAIAGTTSTGNDSLSAESFNRVTVAAWSTLSPYVAPVGSCIWRYRRGIAPTEYRHVISHKSRPVKKAGAVARPVVPSRQRPI